MGDTLLVLGVGCIVAAIVGGGLKIANLLEIPGFASYRRQVLLALFGVVLMLLGSQGPPGPAASRTAPDLSGTWIGEGSTDVAEIKRHFQYVYFPPANMSFTFSPDGDALHGTLRLRKDDRFFTSDTYDYGLLDGTIDGERLAFTVRSDFAVNNDPRVAVERFSGRVDGDRIHFTVQEDTGYPPLEFSAIRQR
jgi:hypothetical protein